MDKTDCIICGDSNCVTEQEELIPGTPAFKNVGEVFANMKTSHCGSCGSIYATEEQIVYNSESFRNAVQNKENRVNRTTFLQRLAGKSRDEETIPDYGGALGAGKYYH